jgi:predicted MPP superfamily phosphohydrolase
MRESNRIIPRGAVMLLLLLVAILLYPAMRLLPYSEGPWRAVALAALVGLGLLHFWVLPPRRHEGAAARRRAWAGYLAMGYTSSLFVFTLLRDLTLGAELLLRGVLGWAASSSWAAISAAGVPLLALAASLLGLYLAQRVPPVRRVDVPLRDLPEALHGFTIAQISDLHVGPTIRSGFVEAVVARTNALEAHLVALTGDLVDGSVAALRGHTAPLGRLRARHGVFTVTGNHEYYSGADEWVMEYDRLGLNVLQNRHVRIDHEGASLILAGITDYAAHHILPEHRSDPQAALADAPSGLRVLLAHQPRSAAAAAAAGAQLMLAGHTHGGQFFPWRWAVPLQQPFISGLHRLGELTLYISRGTGYWGPPKRLGASSEISLLRLVPARSS